MITVDDKKISWHKDITVADILKQIKNTDLCSVIRLNKKLISSPNFKSTKIPKNAKIQLLPLVNGG